MGEADGVGGRDSGVDRPGGGGAKVTARKLSYDNCGTWDLRDIGVSQRRGGLHSLAPPLGQIWPAALGPAGIQLLAHGCRKPLDHHLRQSKKFGSLWAR